MEIIKDLNKNKLRLLAAYMKIDVLLDNGQGIKDRHGWQTDLAKKLHMEGVLNSPEVNRVNIWINRGIPAAVILAIDKLGIPRNKWYREQITREMIWHAMVRKDPDYTPKKLTRRQMATAVMDDIPLYGTTKKIEINGKAQQLILYEPTHDWIHDAVEEILDSEDRESIAALETMVRTIHAKIREQKKLKTRHREFETALEREKGKRKGRKGKK